MSDAGYTLTEMLVAMMMASLALGGMATATQMVGKAEQRLAASRGLAADLRRLDNEVRAAFTDAEWFGAGERAPGGTATRFSVGCGEAETCSLDLRPGAGSAEVVVRRGAASRVLRLRGVSRPRLAYLAAGGEQSAATADGSLRGIVLADGARRLALYRVTAEQASNCNFDARTGDCTPAGAKP